MWYTKKRQVKKNISDRTLFVGGHGMGKGLNVKDERVQPDQPVTCRKKSLNLWKGKLVKQYGWSRFEQQE